MDILTLQFVPKLYCSIVGHDFRIEKEVTNYIKEYKCACCGKEVTISAGGTLVPLTPELKYIHLGLQSMVIKRRSRRL